MLSLLLSRDTGDEQRVFDRMPAGVREPSAGGFRGAVSRKVFEEEEQDESEQSGRERE